MGIGPAKSLSPNFCPGCMVSLVIKGHNLKLSGTVCTLPKPTFMQTKSAWAQMGPKLFTDLRSKWFFFIDSNNPNQDRFLPNISNALLYWFVLSDLSIGGKEEEGWEV